MKSRLNRTTVITHSVQWSIMKKLSTSWTQLLKFHCVFSQIPINCQAEYTMILLAKFTLYEREYA